MSAHKDANSKYLQAINKSLSCLIEQTMDMPSPKKGKKTQATSLLIACLIPNISRDMWQTCLAADRSKQPFLESCVALEVSAAKLPNLYTYIHDLLAQADNALCPTKTVPLTSASQVHVDEKHFLFFGALHD